MHRYDYGIGCRRSGPEPTRQTLELARIRHNLRNIDQDDPHDLLRDTAFEGPNSDGGRPTATTGLSGEICGGARPAPMQPTDETIIAAGKIVLQNYTKLRIVVTEQNKILRARSRCCCGLHALFVLLFSVSPPLVFVLVVQKWFPTDDPSFTCANISDNDTVFACNSIGGEADNNDLVLPILQAVAWFVAFLWNTEVSNLSSTRVHLKVVCAKLDVAVKQLGSALHQLRPAPAIAVDKPGPSSVEESSTARHRSDSDDSDSDSDSASSDCVSWDGRRSSLRHHAQFTVEIPLHAAEADSTNLRPHTRRACLREVQHLVALQAAFRADVTSAVDAAQGRLLCCCAGRHLNPSCCIPPVEDCACQTYTKWCDPASQESNNASTNTFEECTAFLKNVWSTLELLDAEWLEHNAQWPDRRSAPGGDGGGDESSLPSFVPLIAAGWGQIDGPMQKRVNAERRRIGPDRWDAAVKYLRKHRKHVEPLQKHHWRNGGTHIEWCDQERLLNMHDICANVPCMQPFKLVAELGPTGRGQ